MEHRNKYTTVEDYLDKLLYPSLRIAINDLINEIKRQNLTEELEREFNKSFFKGKGAILQNQKYLLKLERASDYSEGDYDYWVRQNMTLNESNNEKPSQEIKEDYDPDLDDSDILDLEEEELNQVEEEPENKFDPIKFLVERLKEVNRNKCNVELEEALENTENERDDII